MIFSPGEQPGASRVGTLITEPDISVVCRAELTFSLGALASVPKESGSPMVYLPQPRPRMGEGVLCELHHELQTSPLIQFAYQVFSFLL